MVLMVGTGRCCGGPRDVDASCSMSWPVKSIGTPRVERLIFRLGAGTAAVRRRRGHRSPGRATGGWGWWPGSRSGTQRSPLGVSMGRSQ